MPSNTNLGPRIEGYVDELVRAGRYGSRDDVLRAGVRLVEERETRLAALDAAIARGLDDADADRVTPARAVGERLTAKYEAQARARDA